MTEERTHVPNKMVDTFQDLHCEEAREFIFRFFGRKKVNDLYLDQIFVRARGKPIDVNKVIKQR